MQHMLSLENLQLTSFPVGGVFEIASPLPRVLSVVQQCRCRIGESEDSDRVSRYHCVESAVTVGKLW